MDLLHFAAAVLVRAAIESRQQRREKPVELQLQPVGGANGQRSVELQVHLFVSRVLEARRDSDAVRRVVVTRERRRRHVQVLHVKHEEIGGA